MTIQQETMALIVRALNAWLKATGNNMRIEARDVVVTIRDGVIFLAFPTSQP